MSFKVNHEFSHLVPNLAVSSSQADPRLIFFSHITYLNKCLKRNTFICCKTLAWVLSFICTLSNLQFSNSIKQYSSKCLFVLFLTFFMWIHMLGFPLTQVAERVCFESMAGTCVFEQSLFHFPPAPDLGKIVSSTPAFLCSLLSASLLIYCSLLQQRWHWLDD